MGVALHVGDRSFEIGTSTFLKAFFSTVAVHAEGNTWGSRFPAVMNGLYEGRIDPETADAALHELDSIQQALTHHGPGELVWDFEDRGARPPWGDNISPTITSLANYFVTSEGRDLFEVLREGFRLAVETGEDAHIT